MSETGPVTLVERRERVLEIILNRPHRKNAVTGPLVDELSTHLRTARDDNGIGAVLIRGADGVFCSGLDLKEFGADPPPPWLGGFAKAWKAFHQELYHCEKPTICALQGFAINAGSALALAADFLLAERDAFLHVGEVRMGRAAPMNLAWLRLKASRSAFVELALLGNRTPAARLAELGLVFQICDGNALDAARELAAELAALSTETVAGMKARLRAFDAAGGLSDPFAIAAGDV
jgi:enoyl-CoA hydratase/carnithine racemase